MTIYGQISKETLQRWQHQQEVWSKSKGRCWYCGVQTLWELTPPFHTTQQFCIDHVIPLSAGGRNDLANLVPACRLCNGRKGTLSVEAFRAKEAQRSLPLFTPEHITYLHALGIVLPPDFPCIPPLVFWFERHGLPA